MTTHSSFRLLALVLGSGLLGCTGFVHDDGSGPPGSGPLGSEPQPPTGSGPAPAASAQQPITSRWLTTIRGTTLRAHRVVEGQWQTVLVTDAYAEGSLQWSPSGAAFTYGVKDNGRLSMKVTRVMEQGLDTPHLLEDTDPDLAHVPEVRWSPRGDRFVYQNAYHGSAASSTLVQLSSYAVTSLAVFNTFIRGGDALVAIRAGESEFTVLGLGDAAEPSRLETLPSAPDRWWAAAPSGLWAVATDRVAEPNTAKTVLSTFSLSPFGARSNVFVPADMNPSGRVNDARPDRWAPQASLLLYSLNSDDAAAHPDFGQSMYVYNADTGESSALDTPIGDRAWLPGARPRLVIARYAGPGVSGTLYDFTSGRAVDLGVDGMLAFSLAKEPSRISPHGSFALPAEMNIEQPLHLLRLGDSVVDTVVLERTRGYPEVSWDADESRALVRFVETADADAKRAVHRAMVSGFAGELDFEWLADEELVERGIRGVDVFEPGSKRWLDATHLQVVLRDGDRELALDDSANVQVATWQPVR